MKKIMLSLLIATASFTGAASIQPDTAEAAIAPAKPNATVVSSVSFRKGPSTNYARIRYLNAGEQLWIIEKVNPYWYKTKDKNNVVGYVTTSSRYVNSSYVELYRKLTPSEAAEKVIAAGKKYLGTPYEYGSSRSDTSTFDCSDFVRQAFKDGIQLTLPADSRGQATYVKQIGKTTTDWHQLKRGDLMFFMSYKGSKASSYAGIDKSSQTITHSGIYLGNGQILHTYSVESGGVKISSIANTAWEYRFVVGGTAL